MSTFLYLQNENINLNIIVAENEVSALTWPRNNDDDHKNNNENNNELKKRCLIELR